MVVGVGEWKLIDVLSNLDWIFTIGSNPQVQRVWKLLTTPAGSLVFLAAGLAWLIVCARTPASPPQTKQESGVPQQEQGTRPSDKARRRDAPNLVLLTADIQRLSFRCLTRYVKVAFFRGTSLRPVPPGEPTNEEVRYVDLHEGELDEKQMGRWIRQACALPGWVP